MVEVSIALVNAGQDVRIGMSALERDVADGIDGLSLRLNRRVLDEKLKRPLVFRDGFEDGKRERLPIGARGEDLRLWRGSVARDWIWPL